MADEENAAHARRLMMEVIDAMVGGGLAVRGMGRMDLPESGAGRCRIRLSGGTTFPRCGSGHAIESACSGHARQRNGIGSPKPANVMSGCDAPHSGLGSRVSTAREGAGTLPGKWSRC
jgi:hypothetical protein